MYKRMGKVTDLLIVLLLLNACVKPVQAVEEIPLAPLSWLVETGEVIPLRAPLHVHDTRYHLVGYTAEGERTSSYGNEILFPTDVIIVFKRGMRTPTVFLARSPHGGCLLLWRPDDMQFEDPCFGSRFDSEGKYWSGPSPRGLDQLPATVRGKMLWVKGELIYGKSHP